MQFLDSDVLIDVIRGYPPAVEWFHSLRELPLIPGFVVMELIQAAENRTRVETSLHLVKPFPVVWPTQADCTRALIQFQSLHLSHGLGLLDSLIASSAVGRGATLLTFNFKHFRPVPDLLLAKPYKRKIVGGR